MFGLFRRIRKINDIEKILNEARAQLKDMHNALNDSSKIIKDIRNELKSLRERSDNLDKVRSYQRDLMFWEGYKNPNEELKDAKKRFFLSLPPASGYERKLQKIFVELLLIIHNSCIENDISYWLDFGTLLGAFRHKGFIPWDDDIDIGMMRTDAERLKQVLSSRKELVVNHRFLNIKDAGIHKSLQVRWADTEKGPFLPALDIFIYDYCDKKSVDNWDFFISQKKALVLESKKLLQYNNEKPNTLNENYLKMCSMFEQYYGKIKENLNITDEKNNYIIWGFDNAMPYTLQVPHFFDYNMIFPLRNIDYEGGSFYVPNRYEDYISGVYSDILSLPTEMLSHRHFSLDDKNKEKIDILFDEYCNLSSK